MKERRLRRKGQRKVSLSLIHSIAKTSINEVEGYENYTYS